MGHPVRLLPVLKIANCADETLIIVGAKFLQGPFLTLQKFHIFVNIYMKMKFLTLRAFGLYCMTKKGGVIRQNSTSDYFYPWRPGLRNIIGKKVLEDRWKRRSRWSNARLCNF